MKTSLIIFVVFLFSSCATVLKGSREKVYFTSSKGDASVYINGKYISNTPFYTKLPSNNSYEVVLVKDSINRKTIIINRNFKPGYLVGDILLIFTVYLSPSILIDIATGAWYQLDKNHIYID